MKFSRWTIVLVLVLGAVALLAQEPAGTDGCDYAAMEGIITDLVGGLDAQDDPDAALMQMQSLVSAFRADCAGMRWTSDEEGLQPVIGPVAFGEWVNIYRVTFKTDGFGIVSIEPLEGACGDALDRSLFNVFEAQASDGAQTVWQGNDCVALIEIGNTTEAWELMFERMD